MKTMCTLVETITMFQEPMEVNGQTHSKLINLEEISALENSNSISLRIKS